MKLWYVPNEQISSNNASAEYWIEIGHLKLSYPIEFDLISYSFYGHLIKRNTYAILDEKKTKKIAP